MRCVKYRFVDVNQRYNIHSHTCAGVLCGMSANASACRRATLVTGRKSTIEAAGELALPGLAARSPLRFLRGWHDVLFDQLEYLLVPIERRRCDDHQF